MSSYSWPVHEALEQFNVSLPDNVLNHIMGMYACTLSSMDDCRSDFYVTIRWDNGCESFLNSLFFVKTVSIVNKVLV